MIRNNLLLTGDDGYNLTKSLRFRSSASAYLNRNQSSGNSQTFTWSGWIKRGKLGAAQDIFGTIVYPSPSNQQSYFSFNSDDTFHIDLYSGSSYFGQLYTSQVFRDPSAWYHIVVAFDTTQSTASNRIKLYVNGSQITAFGTANYPSQNANTYINNSANSQVGIGRVAPYNDSQYFDGYMAEINFVDGQQLTPSSFGSTNALTGVWQPTKYTGTYGTNGFYLPFTNTTSTTTLGYDFSGNGNNWTTNNISLTSGSTYDSMTDVPTLTSATTANYCVMNPLAGASVVSLTNGNLTASEVSASGGSRGGTFGVSSGKWYWEVTPTTAYAIIIGVYTSYETTTYNLSGYAQDGSKYQNQSGSAYGASYVANDVIGVALNLDAGTLTFYKNNTSQGTAFTGLTGTWFPAIRLFSSAANFNFGQQPFAYTPPTGFVALNSYNLPSSTIVKGNTVMDATLYSGNDANRTVTNAAGFKPDFVWIKGRNAARFHNLFDSVRGAGYDLRSNSTASEVYENDTLTAFASNGFSLGTDVTSGRAVNYTGDNYVAWQWQAGQGTTSSNTNGSITSTVSINATAGFSIFTFNSGSSGTQTVGHGLGVTPSMVIFKSRSNGVQNWTVWHSAYSNPAQGYQYLNLTNAVANDASQWSNTAPTSSVFTYNSGYVFSTNITMVAYAWAEVAGFSKFGSYTGNGSTDGPFVATNFKPKFVMVKNTTTGGAGYDWFIYDTARDTYNLATKELEANLSTTEDQYGLQMDILSNGFKLRSSGAGANGSGDTYIYMAFASNPFKHSLGA